MLDGQVFAGGFADPVLASQATFRAVMDAMARPGTVHAIGGDGVTPPAPLSPCAAAVALTLVEHDTPVWLDPVLKDAHGLAEWLIFHTGAPITEEESRAAFAIIHDGAALPDFAGFAQGTDEYPDRSTTLIVQVQSFDSGAALELAGPGILGSRSFAPSPLPADFVARWAENRALFPRGVDLILCTLTEVAALPRSARMEG